VKEDIRLIFENMGLEANPGSGGFANLPPLADADVSPFLQRLKSLYESPDYEKLKLWPATRAFLLKRAKNTGRGVVEQTLNNL
jgi:hypothetical protein